MTQDSEIWKPVVGYEGFYEISSLGRVRTVARLVKSKSGSLRNVQSRIRVPCLVNGYHGVKLSKENKSKTEIVHRLVLEAFVGPRPDKNYDACHWDGCRTNNSLKNLRWDTKSQNKADAFRHGVAPIGEKVAASKLTIDFVKEVLKDKRSGADIARSVNVNRSTINKIRAGKSWRRALEQVSYG